MIFGTIKNQRLDVRAAAAADTIDYLTADFSFLTSDWDGLVKYAHFKQGNTRYSVQLTDDKVTESDHLNLSKGEWTVYLHGNEYRDGEVIQRVTTNIATFTVEPTGVLDGDPFPEVEPSIVEQIEAELTDHEERITAIEEAGGADVVKDVRDSEGNSLVNPETKIATLPEIPEQVQSDWTQSDSSAKDYIKNKPTIVNPVQPDWNQSDSAALDFIKNKPSIPSIAGLEETANKVTSLSAQSTDTQYPSAKCVYDLIGGLDDLIGTGVVS